MEFASTWLCLAGAVWCLHSQCYKADKGRFRIQGARFCRLYAFSFSKFPRIACIKRFDTLLGTEHVNVAGIVEAGTVYLDCPNFAGQATCHEALQDVEWRLRVSLVSVVVVKSGFESPLTPYSLSAFPIPIFGPQSLDR
jgi:hypothetical protein